MMKTMPRGIAAQGSSQWQQQQQQQQQH